MATLALGFLGAGSILSPLANLIPNQTAAQVVGGILNPLGALTGLMGAGQAPAQPDYSGVFQIAEMGIFALAGIYLLTRNSGGGGGGGK